MLQQRAKPKTRDGDRSCVSRIVCRQMSKMQPKTRKRQLSKPRSSPAAAGPPPMSSKSIRTMMPRPRVYSRLSWPLWEARRGRQVLARTVMVGLRIAKTSFALPPLPSLARRTWVTRGYLAPMFNGRPSLNRQKNGPCLDDLPSPLDIPPHPDYAYPRGCPHCNPDITHAEI